MRRADRGIRIIAVVAARPTLWPTAVRQAVRMTPPHWWRRRPYLPVPDGAYLRFRLETQYGRDTPPDPTDVVEFLRWCREHDR